jgi:outer membrane biosynthesis protein TonB
MTGARLVLSMLAVTFSGCLGASAKGVVESPRLEMPSPPPRVVETVEAVAPPPVALVEEPPHQPIPPPERQAPRSGTARPEPPKPEAPLTEAPKTGEEPPRASTLQTTPTVEDVEVERNIRGLLLRANNDLGRVNYRALSADGRTQYDSAIRFIRQAEEALEPRTRNLIFARNLADKALALAVQLAGR